MALDGGTPRLEGVDMATGDEATAGRSTQPYDEATAPNPQRRELRVALGSTVADVEEAESRNVSLWKRSLRMGTWNVRTMRGIGKLQLLIREMEQLRISVLGICETRWSGAGHYNTEDALVIHSGSTEGGQAGVAIMLRGITKKSMVSYSTVSDRIIACRLKTSPIPTTIIQVYAPTSTHNVEDIEMFYEQLQATIEAIPRNEMYLLIGDFNAKVEVRRTQTVESDVMALANRMSVVKG